MEFPNRFVERRGDATEFHRVGVAALEQTEVSTGTEAALAARQRDSANVDVGVAVNGDVEQFLDERRGERVERRVGRHLDVDDGVRDGHIQRFVVVSE